MYDAERLRARLGAVPVATVTSSDDVGAGVPHVLVHDRRAAKEITQHLLHLGHTTVHHVTVPGPHGGPQGRELGWSEALVEAGAPVPPVHRGLVPILVVYLFLQKYFVKGALAGTGK